MTWKQIKQPEDPDWVEWHKEIAIPTRGLNILKLWHRMGCARMNGYFSASITDLSGHRCIKILQATTIESAKTEAEQWARGE